MATYTSSSRPDTQEWDAEDAAQMHEAGIERTEGQWRQEFDGMLTYAHVCERMLTYVNVCERM
jgi:hypothetical protein